MSGFEANDREELRRRLEEYAATRDTAVRDEIVGGPGRPGRVPGPPVPQPGRAHRGPDPGRRSSACSRRWSVSTRPAGLEFSTFATPTIVGELKRHFRDKGWAVRVPRRVQELHLRMGSVVNALSQELGRSPTIPEIAARAEVSVDEVLEAMEAGRGLPVQLDRRQPRRRRGARDGGRHRPARAPTSRAWRRWSTG